MNYVVLLYRSPVLKLNVPTKKSGFFETGLFVLPFNLKRVACLKAGCVDQCCLFLYLNCNLHSEVACIWRQPLIDKKTLYCFYIYAIAHFPIDLLLNLRWSMTLCCRELWFEKDQIEPKFQAGWRSSRKVHGLPSFYHKEPRPRCSAKGSLFLGL